MLIKLLADRTILDVPLEYMEVKDSVFIPTLHNKDTRAALRKAADQLQYKVSFKSDVIDGYLGIVMTRID